MTTQGFQGPDENSTTSEPVTPSEGHAKNRKAQADGGTRHKIASWTRKHANDLLWAAVFALVAAVVVSWFYDPPKPAPYTIYVVAHPQSEPETMAIFAKMESLAESEGLNLRTVPVHVKVEKLETATSDAAVQKARDLANRTDTLLVIANLPSQLVEDSLPAYFLSDPPVPVLSTTASDEDLLVKCHAANCAGPGGFTPLLQLSPTNKEQGRAAILFATQHGLRHFMIVSDDDTSNATYTSDLTQSYYDAIDEFNREQKDANTKASIVGKYSLN